MKSIYLNKNIIGSDETGVGDYLSPLVVASVFVPVVHINKLKKLGITDSKKLSDKKILELFEEIKHLIKSSVRFMKQKQYNFLNKKYNANELKMYLHMQAISAVEKRIDKIDLIILDAFSNDKSLNKYRNTLIKEEGFDDFINPIKYVTKGEMEHISVATASIVARTYFIKLMEKQEIEWKMKFPLGTNMIVEKTAINFIKKYGKENLYNVAKISFKTTKKIMKLI